MGLRTAAVWVADITYVVLLSEAFNYLAVVLDAFGRKVVGWAMEGTSRRVLRLPPLKWP